MSNLSNHFPIPTTDPHETGDSGTNLFKHCPHVDGDTVSRCFENCPKEDIAIIVDAFIKSLQESRF